MLAVISMIAIAIVMFSLGYVAALIVVNHRVTSMINSTESRIEKERKVAHKQGWHAALDDRLMIASKYHEYYPNGK